MKVIPPRVPKSACSCPRTGLVWEAKAARQGQRRWQCTVVQPAREMGQGLMQRAVSLTRGRGKILTALESNPP
jgi:hypothetical protein